MAGKIAGITIQFNGDTTKLSSALSKIKGETRSLDTQLREVNNALKFNPTNTELLAQKQTILKQRIAATEQQLKELKNAQAQLDASGVDKSSAEYQKLRREIITTESKLQHFNSELKQTYTAKLSALGEQFKSVGQSMVSAGTKMSIAGVGAIAVGKKLLDLTQTQSDAENKLVEIYRSRMGASKSAAQSTMDLASKIQKVGVVGDEVTLSGAQQLATFAKYPSTVNKLLPAMDNLLVQQHGLSASAEDATSVANLMGKVMMGQTGALKRVGISFTSAQEKVLKYGNEQEKAAMLAQVITDNVGEMNTKFAQTDAGKIQQAKNALGDLGEEMGAAILPAVAKLVSKLSETLLPAIQGIVNFCESHPVIGDILVGITAVLAVGGPLLVMIGGLAGAIGNIMTLMATIGPVSLAGFGPMIVVIGACVAAGILLIKNWDSIKAGAVKFAKSLKSTFTSLLGVVKTIWTGIKSAIQVPFKVAVAYVQARVALIKKIFNGLKSLPGTVRKIFNDLKTAITHPIQTAKSVLSRLVSAIKRLFSGMHLSFPHVKVPHFNVYGGKAPWGIGGKGKKPSISIDWYRNGGIFDTASLIGVGEAGSEGVIPLDPFWKKMDEIGNSITNGVLAAMAVGSANAAGAAGPVNITLYAFPSGPEMGSWVYDTYNQQARVKKGGGSK